MKILFTGTSSFTGYWFVKSLVDCGHEVVATCSKTKDEYKGLYLNRLKLLENICRIEYGQVFGSEEFINLIANENRWDILCHHAADVRDYKNIEFDYVGALERNTKNLLKVLEFFKRKNGNGLVLTGSVFESNEGAGDDNLRAFSPYGLSKAMTGQVFEYFSKYLSTKLGKFVISNPFGAYENPRFTTYLMKTWQAGNTVSIRTPNYIRDNIHVGLLACCYRKFVSEVYSSGMQYMKINPSGYVESQEFFAKRFAFEIKKRTGLECKIKCLVQEEYKEPVMRINNTSTRLLFPDWSESQAWDYLVEYYNTQELI